MNHVLIQLRNIEKSFGKQRIINGLNLDIDDGEFLTLLGPSGCGKTTLLRMINGFETPDKGQVLLDGKNQSEIPPNKRQVNTVFQSYALFPHLNVRDNIAFALKMKGADKDEIKKRVDEVMELTDLEALAERRPSKLSGGQQQRVAIARSLVNKPKVLLLDEPLGALDLKLRKQMQIELRKMQKQLGITYVYVTHDQEEALTISDRIVVMNKGNIEQAGAPLEIYYNPKTRFVADFLGESNFFEGRVEDGKFIYSDIQIPVDEADGRARLLSVRPEFVRISRKKPDGFCLEARVNSITYLGHTNRIELELAGGKLIYALDESDTVKNIENVYISWNSCDCRLITK